MSFKREGDDSSELNILKKRRVEELLSRDIPDDEAHLMRNGRFACLVCSHQPVLDTVEMLCVHRDGKRHQQCAEHFFQKKREFRQLVEKRRQDLSLHGNSTDNFKNSEAPLLMRTQAASRNALLRYAPYNPVSSGAQSGRNSATEDFKTKRSKTKGFFEYTRNYLTNNVPARYGRVGADSSSEPSILPSLPDNSCHSLLLSNKGTFDSESKVSSSPAAEVTMRPYISKKNRKDQTNDVVRQKSGAIFSVKQTGRHVENDESKDIKQLDEEDETWESISQFPPPGECKIPENDLQGEKYKYRCKSEEGVYARASSDPLVALKRSHNSVNRKSVSYGTKSTVSKSRLEGSVHDDGATGNHSETRKDKSFHSIEGSRYDRDESIRYQTETFLGESHPGLTSSSKRVTLSQRNLQQQRNKECDEPFVVRTKSVVSEEQSRMIGKNKTSFPESSIGCAQDTLQQGSSDDHPCQSREEETGHAQNSLTDVKFSTVYKMKPSKHDHEMKEKFQQPIKFTIGMAKREKTVSNQCVSSQFESEINISKNVHHKGKTEVNTVIKPSSKYSAERKQELQRHLELTSSGWVRDPSGRWVKDEDVEFDSDEEEPT